MFSEIIKEGIMVEFDKGGHTAMSLSKMYGLPYSTVYRWLKESGRALDMKSYNLRASKRSTLYLAEVNTQLYELIQKEKKEYIHPNAKSNTDDVVLQLKKIEAALNKLTYAIYAIAYKGEIDKIDEGDLE